MISVSASSTVEPLICERGPGEMNFIVSKREIALGTYKELGR